MENLKNLHFSTSIFIFAISILKPINGEPMVPCYFIFGDSLVDNGNNNNLKTITKVDYLPYGIDFPDGPTGRFSNGRTSADVIGELMGFENFIPSFLNASAGSDILKGVNYASGSAGIRPETGKHWGDNIELARQLQNHQVIISRIVNELGKKSAAAHLNKCLYSIVIGNNDYINNYFLPEFYNTSSQYTPQQYAQVLIQDYSQLIMKLYNYGARKVALTGVVPIGCTPLAMTNYKRNGSLCYEPMNTTAILFNNRLKWLTNQFNSNLSDADFIYLNAFRIAMDYLKLVPGFGITVKRCCDLDENGFCKRSEEICKSRNLFVFYDSLHPTEIVNKIWARVMFRSLKNIL